MPAALDDEGADEIEVVHREAGVREGSAQALGPRRQVAHGGRVRDEVVMGEVEQRARCAATGEVGGRRVELDVSHAQLLRGQVRSLEVRDRPAQRDVEAFTQEVDAA